MPDGKTNGLLAAGGALLLALAACGQKPPAARPPATAAGAQEAAAGASPLAEARATPPAPPLPAAEVAVEQPGARELQPDDELNGDLPPEPQRAVGADAALLHEALDAYQSAGLFWREGAEAEAIAALDLAYERMAKIAAAPGADPLLAQEKENLRQLISKRIVEIYAARRSAAPGLTGSIPRVVNDEVRAEIASFEGRERDFFLEAYRRSGLYRPRIVSALEQAGLPVELAWLPLVESGFKDRALSTARALGLWQFISSTGYRYGLDRSDWIDERMDPERSTAAAIGYLSALHTLFGDWLTALAAYNCGEHNVLRTIGSQKVAYFDQFWDLYQLLPRETRRYVPRFLATLEIVERPAEYGFVLPEPLPPLEYETVEVARATQLAALDRALGLEPGTLQRLNPELRRNATPKTSYPLKVPPGTGPAVLASLPALPKWEPPQTTTAVHRVRAGETLSVLAARYRTSVAELVALNRLRSAHRLSIGQQLRVPDRSGGRSAVADAVVAEAAPVGPGGVYVVRSGDTLGSIAERAKVPLASLLAANGLHARSTIYPGQRLTIPN
jgi:membrane-bound lytic murein transglycosylase D